MYDYGPTDEFGTDVLDGLQRPQKQLSSKYLYDRRGAQLFEQICELREYYITRTELAIMRAHAAAMAADCGRGTMLVEYGSGSSTKTRVLLEHLDEPVAYVPIDIARDHLRESAAALSQLFPDVEVLPVCADFTAAPPLPRAACDPQRWCIYFPGSTIGNFNPDEAARLLKQGAGQCGAGGHMLIGIDLKKERHVLERAYNDADGVTADFNLNLLTRVNRELDADFQREAFRHEAFYNAAKGRVEMHLVSRRRQTVTVADTRIEFEAGESIHTENSHKYEIDEFATLAADAGWRLERHWTDQDRYFGVLSLSVA